MIIGDQLISLNQGIHRSVESGTYKGHGEYTINMNDGGNGKFFTIDFQIISFGGGHFKLYRRDCGDAPTDLMDRGNGALIGGDYVLNFSSR